jgi:hypothetical protein
MADSRLVLTRNAIKTQLEKATDGASLSLTDRCHIGWLVRAITDPNLYDDLSNNGPLAFVGMPSIELEWTGTGPASFPISVMIAKDKGVDWTGNDVLNLVASIIEKLTTTTDYSAGAIAPQRVALADVFYEHEKSQGILFLTVQYHFIDPLGKTKKLEDVG